MLFQNIKSKLIIVSGLAVSLASANPVPQLEGRTTSCGLNYIPACCNFMTWESWPSVIPGLSSGCAPLASEPGLTCPAGASAAGCCQQSPFNNAQLYYYAGNQVYCFGQ